MARKKVIIFVLFFGAIIPLVAGYSGYNLGYSDGIIAGEERGQSSILGVFGFKKKPEDL